MRVRASARQKSRAGALWTGDDCGIAEANDLRAEALQATEPLAERRLGVYLHGSLATGDFVPHRSDLDVLAVVHDDSCGEEELQAFGESLRMAPPAVGVDLHVVEECAVRMPERAAVRLLYARVEPDRRFVFAGRAGDLDLTVTCEIIRRTGVALLGPPPADVFGSDSAGVVAGGSQTRGGGVALIRTDRRSPRGRSAGVPGLAVGPGQRPRLQADRR